MDLACLFSDVADVPPPPEEFDVKQLPAHGGVWLLSDERNRPILLGGSESVRRTVSFRLTHPDQDERRRAKADLRAITRRIWWWPTYSQFETNYDYHRIARQLYPDDYVERLAFGPVWFAKADPGARIPRVAPTQKVFVGGATYIGPFTSRANCTRYIEVLEEMFDLCRCVDILDQAPRGRRCAYADMGKCPAPCDGSIPLEQYAEMFEAAMAFVRRGPEAFIAETQREMKQAAAAQEYERAAAAKRRIDEARKAASGLNRFVTVADRFNWLIVQRGPGRTRVKPFFVRGGWIDRGEVVELKMLEERVPAWIEAMGQASPASRGDDLRQRTEHLWLVSHFLFRSEKLPGLFVRADDLGDAPSLCLQIHEAFPPPARRKQPATEGLESGGSGGSPAASSRGTTRKASDDGSPSGARGGSDAQIEGDTRPR